MENELFGLIYKVTSPSGKVYIGQTTKSLKQRMRSHKNAAVSGSNAPFHRAFRKYGDKLKWEVIHRNVPLASLGLLEIWNIAKYGSRETGYNCDCGGGISRAGAKCSNESRKRMSESHIGQIAWNKGKKMSKEHCVKTSIAHGGKAFNVYKDGHSVGSWINPVECAKDLNLSAVLIRRCLNNKAISHKDYIFQYQDNLDLEAALCTVEDLRIKRLIAGKGTTKYFVVFKNDQQVGTWLSKTQCAKDLGIDCSSISSIFAGRRKSRAGYTFKYLDDKL
jgi:group I intron endonuclease